MRLRAVPESDAAGTPRPSNPLIGRRLGGRYTVERLLGRGRVGLRYLARRAEAPQAVVVEVLAPQWLRGADAEARFDREATRLCATRHPNIVAVLDHGREDDRAYLVMEHVEGELLSDRLAQQGRLSLEEFVPIAAQILKGIGHAHTRELRVRDVDPASVILCERKGRANFVKLLDAYTLDRSEPITDEHVTRTIGYLAPEAIRGETTDLRADVYAIGVLFHAMLCGRLPAATNEPERVGPSLPAELGLPEGLVRLVARCLADHPDDRPADANAVVEELIDAVPAHLFRLPRSSTSTVPHGAGNTGMVELVGQAAVSGPHPVAQREDSGAVLVDTVPISTLETVPTIDAESLAANASSRRVRLRVVALAVAAGALMAVLGGAVAALLFPDDAASSEVAAAGVHVAFADDATAEDTLTEIRRLVDEGRLEAAAELLDRAHAFVASTPALAPRIERLDRALLAARLMNTAARFEGEGDVAAAVSAYRDVLATDPTHAVARSRLSRLTSDATPPTASVATGEVSIDAHPVADLVIDGQRVGSTPYTGRLPTGTHTVRMTARGYQPWEGTVEIAEVDNDPIAVRLHAKGFPRDKAKPREPSVAPAARAPAPEEDVGTSKREVFLPNEGSPQGGGVFLPTKE